MYRDEAEFKRNICRGELTAAAHREFQNGPGKPPSSNSEEAGANATTDVLVLKLLHSPHKSGLKSSPDIFNYGCRRRSCVSRWGIALFVVHLLYGLVGIIVLSEASALPGRFWAATIACFSRRHRLSAAWLRAHAVSAASDCYCIVRLCDSWVLLQNGFLQYMIHANVSDFSCITSL